MARRFVEKKKSIQKLSVTDISSFYLEGEQITKKGATLTKSLPSNEARQELRKRMKYQIDLYNLAKKRFYDLKSSLLKHRRFPTHLDDILRKITLYNTK